MFSLVSAVSLALATVAAQAQSQASSQSAAGQANSSSSSSSNATPSLDTTTGSAAGQHVPVSQSFAYQATQYMKDMATNGHNPYRAQYGAAALTWNDALFPGTIDWATQCQFQHQPGAYGENLYASTNTQATCIDAVNAWMSEAPKYDYSNPGFTAAAGHFSQVVWKGTTGLACALVDCPAGRIFPNNAARYCVCRYSPPGNVQGQFAANVGAKTTTTTTPPAAAAFEEISSSDGQASNTSGSSSSSAGSISVAQDGINASSTGSDSASKGTGNSSGNTGTLVTH